MKLDEIIALAKAGYKKKDIDAIIAENEKPSHDANSSASGESLVVEDATNDAPAASEEVVEVVEEVPKESDITNEALSAAYAEIEKLKADLNAAQKLNTTKEVTNTVDNDAKTVEDMVRSFM